MQKRQLEEEKELDEEEEEQKKKQSEEEDPILIFMPQRDETEGGERGRKRDRMWRRSLRRIISVSSLLGNVGGNQRLSDNVKHEGRGCTARITQLLLFANHRTSGKKT